MFKLFKHSSIRLFFTTVVISLLLLPTGLTTSASPPARPALDPAPPTFSSGNADVDGAYTKALSTIAADIVNGKFIAGQNWSQVWTRDTSYSIDLGAGLIHPTVSKTTMNGMTENVSGIGTVWIQDAAGHFGGWPNLTDSIVGAVGAWSIYLTTGDQAFLSWSYTVTKNTLARAERDAYHTASGLFKGCSTFMESNSGYPSKYANNGALMGQTKALSTNLLYYQGYTLAARMGTILGAPASEINTLQTKATNLKNAINTRLWQPSRGYYAYFEDENGVLETRMEGTGEAFAILWGVADAAKTQSILANTPITTWGIPSLWPQYSAWMNYNAGCDCDYYHNGMIWPFVQGYWNWAATKGQSVAKAGEELNDLVALSKKAATFHEFYRPEDGLPDGSPRQLWSASGYLSAIYHGLFGMNFDTDGLRFSPVVPSMFSNLTLNGVTYRGMTLNITVTGSGTSITSFKVDGVANNNFIPASLTGMHTVAITMGTGPTPTPGPTSTPLPPTNTPVPGANLVQNPSFETAGGSASDSANWTEGVNHARASDKFKTGNWSLKSTFRTGGTDTRQTVTIVANTNYTYSGYIWRTNSTGAAYLDMNDIAGELTLPTSATGAWTLVSGTWNSGTRTSVTLRAVTDANPTGDIWFDDISLSSPGGPTSTPTNTSGPTPTRTPTPSSGTNLALNKPATADSSCNANETANKAVNGTWTGGNSDKWCSLGTTKWWQVDLGAAVNVSQFVIYHAGAGGENTAYNTRDFTIQTSTDNVNWTTRVTVSGNTANTTTHNITSVSARYIKLNVTTGAQSGQPNTARIYEVQVFGP